MTHSQRLMAMQIKTASSSASGGQAARQELGLGDDFYATSSGQRERMLQSTEKLNRTGDRIKNGRQQLLETEVSIRISHLPSHFKRALLTISPELGVASWAEVSFSKVNNCQSSVVRTLQNGQLRDI